MFALAAVWIDAAGGEQRIGCKAIVHAREWTEGAQAQTQKSWDAADRAELVQAVHFWLVWTTNVPFVPLVYQSDMLWNIPCTFFLSC